jgi:ATP-binding protein involved in chromosome partitioning
MNEVKPKDCETCGDEACEARQKQPEEKTEAFLERQAIARRMCKIKYKVLVLSGKGGVGKSTVAVNLAYSLSRAGQRVGVMDVDIHGPNAHKMLGAEKANLAVMENSIRPAIVGPNLKLMSIAYLLRQDSDAVIWRGPLKMGLIKQFLRDVEWGDLDYLIIDAPPGTGDEPLSVAQLIPDLNGAVVVTTPQEVSILDVRKSITFCKQLNLPVLGIVENMSGFICPHCKERVDIFKSGGGEELARSMGIAFLGSIPLDGNVVSRSDRGETVLKTEPEGDAAKAFEQMRLNLEKVLKRSGN